MSNQRETIIDSVVSLLENIVIPPYNNHPIIQRGIEHWNDTMELPAIFIDEGEAETIENAAFAKKQGMIDLVIISRLRGDWTTANGLQEDIRIIMDSTANTYVTQMNHVSSRVSKDMETDLKEIEMHYQVVYWYDAGAA